ncbi:MAG: cardiolipin synthase B [Acidimicrobiia bacterium]|nr:cardiolipin synthase B [Acidimicrobiia bacterium]
MDNETDVSDFRDDIEYFRHAVASVVGPVFTEGNSVDVLRNGREIFPSMLEAIRNAKTSIDFVTFVYWTGDVARDFAAAFAERARAGVRVRIILDGFGALPMDRDLIHHLEAGGAQVEIFRPVVRWKFWESDHRTHRKILICDDTVGFTGGVGIASEWQGDARSPDEWRDTHFRITGPAVRGLQAAFLADWRDTGHPIDACDLATEASKPSGDMLVGVVDGSAHIGFNPAERLFEGLLAAATRSILLQTPYFNPSDGLIHTMVEARRRGVEIDVILPGPYIDKRVSSVVAADRSSELLRHGVRLWEYQPTMMHVKSVVVDGIGSIVGSVNFNRRSVEKDEEVAIVALDRGLASTLTDHFLIDVRECRSVTDSKQLVGRATRLLAPVLRLAEREF